MHHDYGVAFSRSDNATIQSAYTMVKIDLFKMINKSIYGREA